MKNSFCKTVVLLFLSLILAVLFVDIHPAAQQIVEFDSVFLFRREDTYSRFRMSHADAIRPDTITVIRAVDYIRNYDTVTGRVNYMGRDDVLRIDNRSGILEWEFYIEEAGLYNIKFDHLSLAEFDRRLLYSLRINGEIPFGQASRLFLPTVWKDAGPMRMDSRGNDLRPAAIAYVRWLASWVSDTEGLYNEPFLFYFYQGINTITLEMRSAPMLIDTITIKNAPKLIPYSEYIAIPRSSRSSPGELSDIRIHIEAEHNIFRSDTTLFATPDRSDPSTSPSHPVALRLNTVGGYGNWDGQGQFKVWEVYAPQAGFYQLAMRIRQNFNVGMTSFRRLYINGEVPFYEANALQFRHSIRWQHIIVGNDDGPFYFYLNEGRNEIKMMAVPGPLGEIITELLDISFSLNYIYRTILMITGPNPDTFRDYQLERDIPGLIPAFEQIYSRIRMQEARLVELSGANLSAGATILNTIAMQIDSFVRQPRFIAERLHRFQWNISSFADFSDTLREQPLEMDYFVFFTEDTEPFLPRIGFFARLWFHIRAFFGSFVNDFSVVGDIAEAEDAITVWIPLWRDQVQIIKDLTDNFFTPETGIQVNIKLVQQGIVPAILSGRAPCVFLFLSNDQVVDLAARGGLVELSQFDTFNDRMQQFRPNAFNSYRFLDGFYAMPIQQSFQMLFVRNDIFEELDLEVPATWDEFYRVMSVLQRNNMNVGIQSENPNIFASLLYQMGGTYFNEDLSRTLLHSSESVEAFRKWTNFFVKYGLPLDFNFYQRFRTGEMPMGIQPYTMFSMMTAAAPEIRGLWNFYPMPGFMNEDGEIINYSVATGSAALILRDAHTPENAWRFIEWFTSTDIQAQYGRELESLIGAWGRFDTANIEAFERLPWEPEQAAVILNQWENTIVLPQVVGGYYINRSIINSFRAVVYHGENTRETLMHFARRIDREIERKRIEFGLE